MSYKNSAYSNKSRTGSVKDHAAHFFHSQQQQRQDQLINKWLQENNIHARQLKPK